MGAAARLVHAVAHRWAGGRWLATGGGGYDAYRVVPRSWSLAWLAASHLEPPAAVPAAWRERWSAEAAQYGQAPLPEWLDDEPNAGLRMDGTQDAADRRAIETAILVRELAVPALVRAAGDLGWWRPLDDLDVPGVGERPVGPPAAADVEPAPRVAEPAIVEDVDAATWARLRLAERVLAAGDPAVGHALVLAALRSPHRARVTVVTAAGWVVGAAISARPEGRRLLLGVGVAPAFRARGLGSELLRRHVLRSGADPDEAWEAVVTVAERDPFEPLARATRAAIARRLLEGAGFRVQRAAGPVGAADPEALVAHRA